MMKTILCLMAVGVAVAAGARDRGSYVAFPFAVSCDEAYVLQTSAYCRARDVYGLQIAPVRNRADGTVFVQLGGSNSAFECLGLQVGVHNDCDGPLTGVQLGVHNQVGLVQGLQMGVANRALGATGFQIGIINVAEWVDGFQIGLLNATAQQGGWGPHTRFLLRVGLFNVAYYKSGDPTCWPLMTLEW